MHELGRRYSLSRNLIRLWIQKYEAGELTDEVVDAVRIAEYENKIAELERKVAQLTMEVDLLKKVILTIRSGPLWSEPQKLDSQMKVDWTRRRAYRRIGHGTTSELQF